MMTLDGVIQAPGAPQEDTSGGFPYGGWVAPYDDESGDAVMEQLLQPTDILLGGTTFRIWEGYWPSRADHWKGINEVTKYVVSTTIKSSDWNNSVFLENLDAIKALKNSTGGDIKVWGSSKLVQLLLQNDLVDELWLLIYPLVLGKGKKLFAEGAAPAAFTLVEHRVTTGGVVVGHYQRAGAVKTGTIGA